MSHPNPQAEYGINEKEGTSPKEKALRRKMQKTVPKIKYKKGIGVNKGGKSNSSFNKDSGQVEFN